ncbi:hypothetical protein BJ170DRAFT_677920 [Xylariales sp. AK1849]|nr:hypothetical protein BJ170DRAFT_677920 [Xylariales sp. AK1849]
MASQDYNRQPLPAPPPHGHQQQYSYSSYDESPLPPPPPAAQQYQPRQQQAQLSQQQSYPENAQYQSQQQQQQQNPERNRPRSRGFSFRSDKSQKTEKSNPGSGVYKVPSAGLHETSAEKQSKRLHSKADPTLAMQEAEPSAVAQAGGNFKELAPLRSIQHKDPSGVPISDPDRSNPTRSKWERPLDTIRSFEAAVDGGYNRQSMIRSDTDSVVHWNTRSSYYGNNASTPRFPHDSYYGGRPNSSFRPESAMFDPRGSAMMSGSGPRDDYFETYDQKNPGYPPQGGNGGRNRYPRMQSEGHLNSHPALNKGVYPVSSNHRSYETVASASGGSNSLGEPSGYQTDLTSSEDSSINRRSPPKRQEPMNDYGISFGQSPTYQPSNLGPPVSQPRTMPDQSHAPPPPPPKGGSGTLLRKPSRVSESVAGARPDLGDKRKSWFSRRFSKNS